jgi:hypothetical protein
MLFQVPVELPDGSHLLTAPDPKLAAYLQMAWLKRAKISPVTLTANEITGRYTVEAPGAVTVHFEKAQDGPIVVEVSPTTQDLLRMAGL